MKVPGLVTYVMLAFQPYRSSAQAWGYVLHQQITQELLESQSLTRCGPPLSALVYWRKENGVPWGSRCRL